MGFNWRPETYGTPSLEGCLNYNKFLNYKNKVQLVFEPPMCDSSQCVVIPTRTRQVIVSHSQTAIVSFSGLAMRD